MHFTLYYEDQLHVKCSHKNNTTEGYEETLGCAGYVSDLDCGNGITGTYM